MNYRTCWLTLNRACNLRCKWCYAKDTGYHKEDNMPLSLAYQIIDICSLLGIRHITLIGGEPTLYPNFFDVIDYCHKKRIHCGIITNGLACASKEFVQELKLHKIKSISLSLKGENAEVFKDITGVDAFEKTKDAIINCLDSGVNVNASMVLTEDNINTYIDGIVELKKLGVKHFHLSFCYEFNTSVSCNSYLQKHNPKQLIAAFVKGYAKLDKITKHNFTLSDGYPLCLWDKEIIERMTKYGQFVTVCQLLARSGLIFDTKGNLIPCNAMPNIKLGKLNTDFVTPEELMEYVNSAKIQTVYSKLCGLPHKTCLTCDQMINCGGGCVCQWTNYDFEQLALI